MQRRTYLRALGGAGLAGAAGCLESIRGSEGDDRTVLEPPERSRGDPDVAAYPVHGEAMPSFSLPDPLTGETVTPEQFEGERAILMTFFFTSCPDSACPTLIQKLLQAQLDAADNGYGEDVAFLAMTFDPETDTPERIEAYADEFGIDLEAGNWHFLRPESYEEAKELLEAEFMPIERERVGESGDGDGGDGDGDGGGENDSHDHDHGDNESDHDHGDEEHDHGDANESDHDDGHEHDHEYDFTHVNLILLANRDGVVERAYPQGTQTATQTILEDLETVVEG